MNKKHYIITGVVLITAVLIALFIVNYNNRTENNYFIEENTKKTTGTIELKSLPSKTTPTVTITPVPVIVTPTPVPTVVPTETPVIFPEIKDEGSPVIAKEKKIFNKIKL